MKNHESIIENRINVLDNNFDSIRNYIIENRSNYKNHFNKDFNRKINR
jgi:hypothetical protein